MDLPVSFPKCNSDFIPWFAFFFDRSAYHASPRETAVQYLFFYGSFSGYEHHPRAVNLLIYSRRFLEFCQPRPQSALVLFTLLVVCSRLSRILHPPSSLFTPFARVPCLRGRPPCCLFDNVIATPPRPCRKFHFPVSFIIIIISVELRSSNVYFSSVADREDPPRRIERPAASL